MLAPKFGNFDRDIKSKLKIMSLEVDSAHQTECSMKSTRNGYGLLRFRLMQKTSAVSATDGWLKLNFASCVIQ